LIWTAYNIIEGYAFRTWGEAAIIAIQVFILIIMYWIFMKPKVNIIPRFMALMMFVSCVGLTVVSLPKSEWNPSALQAEALIPAFMSKKKFLFFSDCGARVPQIWKNIKQGHTGQLAFLTFFLSFGGNAARVFTSYSSKNLDKVVLASHIAAAVFNGTLTFQVLYYTKSTKSALRKQKMK
jgi:mannose-P-dolichol utilization defect 1